MRVVAAELFQMQGVWRSGLNLNEEAKAYFKDERDNPLLDAYFCSAWVSHLHKKMKVNYSYGGYFEDRSYLWRGHYHDPNKMIHLGIDYNVPIHTKVFMPVGGVLIRKFIDRDQNGGWGGQLIFLVKNHYLILGHLSISTQNLSIGNFIEKGLFLGRVATPESNGNWYPHLHVQCMTEKAFEKYEFNVDGYGSLEEATEDLFPKPSVIMDSNSLVESGK